MRDCLVFEGADHVNQGVDITDGIERQVASRPPHHPPDIDEFHGGMNHFAGFEDRGQKFHAFVGNLDNSDVGPGFPTPVSDDIDRSLGQYSEDRRLADLGESDDTAFHEVLSISMGK